MHYFFSLAVLGLHCGAQVSLLVMLGLSCPAVCGILDPQPGMESLLEGGFFTTRWPRSEK